MNTTTLDRANAIPAQSLHSPASTSNCIGINSPSFLVPKGTWLDEAIDLREPEGTRFTEDVLIRIKSVESRLRKRSKAAETNHRQRIRTILANGFRCHLYREPSWVAYLRKAESYRHGPVWLSGESLGHAVDLMAKAKLLTTNLGEYGRASTYRITQALYEIAEQHGIGDNSLTCHLPSEKLVRLRSQRPQRTAIDFTESDDTRRWTTLLDAYNGFLTQQDIALAVSGAEEVEWAARLNKHGNNGSGMPFYRPERFQTDLYRQFNNGSFDEGGRLYGGWWINAPKAMRRKITINGEPTVELDFSGCAIRMLYHERGIDCRDDPYSLPLLVAHEEKEGLGQGHYREGVKALTQALINGDSDGKPERAKIEGFSFKPFTRPDVRRMIEEKHESIIDAFGTGAGLRLQRRDSDLALDIITNMRECGITALPVHDSFIAPKSNETDLREEMAEVYEEVFSFCPIIN